MTDNFERRSLQLTHDEWRELERLAEELHTPALAGTTAGTPSWRSLIKLVAKGEILLKRPDGRRRRRKK